MGCKPDHLPQASPKAKNEWKYVLTPPYVTIECISSTSFAYTNSLYGLRHDSVT